MQPKESMTEQSAEQWSGMDQWSALQLSDELLSSHLQAINCVSSIKGDLAEVGEVITDWLGTGRGRLIYCGAGSAGAQACMDGLELPSTFGWPQSRLVVLLAGGVESFYDQGGLSEDDTELAKRDFTALDICEEDVVIAVSASGNTPYTLAGVQLARAKGALTVALVNNNNCQMLEQAKLSLVLPTGAEAIAGSTRMAAATAQKIALNALSTLVMTRLGFVYDNLMVQMRVSNQKLQARAVQMVCKISDCEEPLAKGYLAEAEQDIPVAVLLAKGHSLSAAQEKLRQCGGKLRDALKAI